jgi:hypothetical protein
VTCRVRKKSKHAGTSHRSCTRAPIFFYRVRVNGKGEGNEDGGKKGGKKKRLQNPPKEYNGNIAFLGGFFLNVPVDFPAQKKERERETEDKRMFLFILIQKPPVVSKPCAS